MSLVDKRLTLSTNLSKKCVDALYAQLDDNGWNIGSNVVTM